MIKRKVQKTGVATYTISLPKSWVLRNNVTSGDEISIQEENDHTLKISIFDQVEKLIEGVIKLDKLNNENEIIRSYISHYLNGVNKIIIYSEKSIPSRYRKKINEQINKLIGFEVVEETDKKIIHQDFFSSQYLSLHQVIKRQFNLSKLIIYEGWKILKKEINNRENINVWEDEVNKLHLLARRQINFALHNSLILNKLNMTVRECQYLIILTSSIEKISDSFKKIAKKCEMLEKIPPEVFNQLEVLYSEIIEAYDQAFRSIYKKDFFLSNEAILKSDKISERQFNLLNVKMGRGTKFNLYLLFSELQTQTHFIKEIAEIGLDIQ